MNQAAQHGAISRDERSITPSLLTIPEAALALRVSKWTLYQLIRSKRLETIKMGTRRLVPVVAVNALVERLLAEENVYG